MLVSFLARLYRFVGPLAWLPGWLFVGAFVGMRASCLIAGLPVCELPCSLPRLLFAYLFTSWLRVIAGLRACVHVCVRECFRIPLFAFPLVSGHACLLACVHDSDLIACVFVCMCVSLLGCLLPFSVLCLFACALPCSPASLRGCLVPCLLARLLCLIAGVRACLLASLIACFFASLLVRSFPCVRVC